MLLMLALMLQCVALLAQTNDSQARKSAEAYWVQGEKLRDAGDYPKAIEAYKQVIALAPETALAADANHGIGWINIDQKDYRGAVIPLGEALRLKPNDSEVNFELGQAFIFLGQNPKAISYLKQAIHLQADFADAYYYLGLAYDLMGDKPDAMDACRKLRPLDAKLAQELLEQIQKAK
jgi:tetratricopeptide (TPR) repeat protein